jgi:uncharacterized coiled-coil protein SlyX
LSNLSTFKERGKVIMGAPIEELQERVKKLEERVSLQEETVEKLIDFVQRSIDVQFAERKAYAKQKRKQENEGMKKLE